MNNHAAEKLFERICTECPLLFAAFTNTEPDMKNFHKVHSKKELDMTEQERKVALEEAISILMKMPLTKNYANETGKAIRLLTGYRTALKKDPSEIIDELRKEIKELEENPLYLVDEEGTHDISKMRQENDFLRCKITPLNGDSDSVAWMKKFKLCYLEKTKLLEERTTLKQPDAEPLVKMLEIMKAFMCDSSYKRTGCEVYDIEKVLNTYKEQKL